MTDGSAAVARSVLPGDRAWLQHAGPVDQALIARWQREVDIGHAAQRRELVDRRAQALQHGISVVVPTYQGRSHIERCLASFAEQTLKPDLFEVIVVTNGPCDGSYGAIEQFRKSHGELDLRVVRLNRSGASRARNVGVAAARRRYTTFVDDDDYVSPAFLEVLLNHAGPRIVPVVPVVDVEDGRERSDNYINSRLRDHLGKLVRPADLTVATSFNAAKAVETSLIKRLRYETDLDSGEDVLLWTTVVVRGQVEFLPCPPESGAIYYRVVRNGSLSRPALESAAVVTRQLGLISRLEPLLAEADAQAVNLVHDRIRQVGHPLGALVRDGRVDHGDVVTALDRHPIFHFPYDVLNRGLSRGLVAAFAFPPYADTSAIVTAKRLRARGEVADVVTNAMDRIRAIDGTTRRISGPFVDREQRLNTPSYFASWDAMATFAQEGLRTVRDWVRTKGPYAWIYSRAHFAASHLLAAMVKLAYPDTKWIAEFSDPLSRDVTGAQRVASVTPSIMDDLARVLRRQGLPMPTAENSFVLIEELTYRLADELVFTNTNQLDYMLSYCDRAELAAEARAKAIVSPQPTLPTVFYSMIEYESNFDDQLVHLGYFGNFYENRGPESILAALKGCDRRIRSQLRVHFYTSAPDRVLALAADYGVADCVVAEPYVDYLRFLNLTTKLDCLVVADALAASGDRNPFLPSKHADYRGSGTPVWGIVQDGSPLSQQRLDYRSALSDAAASADVLAEIVCRAVR